MNVVEMPVSRPRKLTLPLGDLVVAEPALDRLIEEKLPAKTAYHVAKLARLVKQEVAHFTEQRTAAIKELGTEPPDQPGALQVTPENVPEFTRRITELAAVDVTIDWGPLAVADLPATITAGDILRLGLLVYDAEDGKQPA